MPSSVVRVESIADSLTERFVRLYGTHPTIFRAPGRVNLIGEHTDYNDGFVMPAAIDLFTWVAASRRGDRTVQVHSDQFAETVDLSLEALAGPPRKHWSDFIRGVAATIQAAGHGLKGVNLIVDGYVPIGAGLSSSASLEVSTALALLWAAGVELPPLEVVTICQRAEHEYAGTRCGIMDQFIATFGRSGHALMLDCRSLEHTLLPIPADVRLVMCNSMVKHELAAGEYNRRRADCESGVRTLGQHLPNVLALRDVTLADLDRYRNELPELVYRRCRHVIRENERVRAASDALQGGDLVRFGQLMYESHASLREDYEVSCRELDLLVELASTCEGVYGARMTGGGFGGCTINLVRSDAVDRFEDRITDSYAKATGKKPDLFVCSAAQGAGAW
ncbi:MAG TPA: galactokinase [Candidatus Sulfotelmatobacter sp.]|nr:galactokinase [Candidatus Sulfotelmatobacter sp.]